eukprot:SAG11_NODE_32664_length_281_cov_3.532967_1_plen_62_part_10
MSNSEQPEQTIPKKAKRQLTPEQLEKLAAASVLNFQWLGFLGCVIRWAKTRAWPPDQWFDHV